MLAIAAKDPPPKRGEWDTATAGGGPPPRPSGRATWDRRGGGAAGRPRGGRGRGEGGAGSPGWYAGAQIQRGRGRGWAGGRGGGGGRGEAGARREDGIRRPTLLGDLRGDFLPPLGRNFGDPIRLLSKKRYYLVVELLNLRILLSPHGCDGRDYYYYY